MTYHSTRPFLPHSESARILHPMLATRHRPRWTIKRVLVAAVAFYVVICYLFDMPFFSSKLPNYSGPYQVGVVDIETAVIEKRKISDLLFKDTQKPAFDLDTVLFSLYYPAVDEAFKPSKPHHPWVPNISQVSKIIAILRAKS